MSKSKEVERYTSKITQQFVMALMEVEEHFGVEMINKTEVELETENEVWKVTVEKSSR